MPTPDRYGSVKCHSKAFGLNKDSAFLNSASTCESKLAEDEDYCYADDDDDADDGGYGDNQPDVLPSPAPAPEVTAGQPPTIASFDTSNY